MLFPLHEIESLLRRVDEDGSGYRFAVVPTTVDPLSLVRAGSSSFGSALYFSTPDGDAWGGLGAAWTRSTAGARRFGRLDGAFGEAPAAPGPFRFFLGFSFSADGPQTEEWEGFGAADLVLPEVTVGRVGGRTQLMVALRPGRDAASLAAALRDLDAPGSYRLPDRGSHTVESVPSTADWRSAVGDAIAAIRSGSFEKVVLGRSVVVSAEIPTDAFDVAAQLGAAYPQCYAFAWQAGPATFVGASPELLLDKAAEIVRLNPLAGSARRGEGQAEDARLAQELMASEKDRHEHRLVVDDVARRLRPLAGALEVPAGPSLRRLATVQHLSTEIRAQLRDDTSVFELLDVLHPTPAVGGTPRAEAVAFIDKVEGLDRGWYSGGIGWLTPGGDCRLALSLRCGLLRGASARLFAGAGIVADSDPDAELVETRLKFRPLLELLAAT